MLFVKVVFNLHVHCGKVIHSLKYHFGAIEKRKKKKTNVKILETDWKKKSASFLILSSKRTNDHTWEKNNAWT